jgi:DNA-binding NarL/FixJ family response regulator
LTETQAIVRILLVEDHPLWQKIIFTLLQQQPNLQIIAVAADGLAAVQKAKELQPDLVLLDIGLPNLNGIEVAKQVNKMAAPGARLLIVSNESSVDIVREALRVGALGYIYKSNARTELLPAIRAVLEGRHFVGSAAAYSSDKVAQDQPPRGHDVQFYSDDQLILQSVTRFVAAALRAGNPAIVLATESHRHGILRRLRTEGVDVDAFIQKKAFTLLDAADMLSAFMVDDWPDPIRFLGAARGLIMSATAAAKADRPVVAAFGEMVALLWAEGKTDAAIRLEQLWNDLAATHDLDVLCAYPFNCFPAEQEEQSLKRISACHSAVSRA